MEIQSKYPFKFLDAYNRNDRDIFFGREAEIEALYQMVYQTDLILVYGASGTGKTSIINCGLASKFQPYEWLALQIRRGANLNESLNKSLEAELIKAGASSAEDADSDNLDWLLESDTGQTNNPGSPVALKLKQLYLTHFKPVFLIFDQFEELYILGSKEEQRQFVETIREILRMEQPVKILISIREEYLGYLYEFERRVPELLRKKLRIEPMHLEKVRAIVAGINKLGRHSTVTFSKDAEQEIGKGIFEKLKEREHTLTIELPYLQVFLDKLYLKISGDADRKKPVVITPESLQSIGQIGDVLRNFLDEQVVENAGNLKVEPDTIKKLLSPFVTLDGTKEPLSAAQLHARLPELDEALINRSLEAFQSGRILRFDEKELRYEVAHDSLARQIATYQDAEDVARQKALQIIRTQMLLEAEKRDVFTERQLVFMEPHLERLELSDDEKEWIAHSRQYREEERLRDLRESEEKLQQAEAQAATEKHLREDAVQKAKLAKQRTRWAAVIAAFALVLAGVAGVFKLQADKATANAEREQQAARKAEQAALASKADAERNFAEAKAQEAKALAATKAAADNLKQAEDNLRRARRQERKTKEALAQVQAEKTATEAQRKIAEENVEKAEQARREAAAERDRARAALDNLETSNRQVVILLLNNLEKDIIAFKYEEAYEKALSAASLKVEKPEVAAAMLELAFWYGETGDKARADTLLRTAYQLLEKPFADTRDMHQALRALDKGTFDKVMKRYYPLDTVFIAGGPFEMGCKPGRDDVDGYRGDDETPHPRRVADFLMLRHEITWWQYRLFCAATDKGFDAPGWGTQGDNPVVNVSWNDAVAYAKWLNRRLGYAAGKGYRLPSEAEWEYAARGGVESAYAGCNSEEELEEYAWYYINSESRPQQVKTRKPNGYGLYDMSGNVWEWCEDDYHEDYKAGPVDGRAWVDDPRGSLRVLRGGSWFNFPVGCRVASRRGYDPENRYDIVGFRLVFVP